MSKTPASPKRPLHKSLSPMMQQYQEAKALCGDALLLFRMGDFYELFYEDAKVAAKALGLTLTSRDKGTNPIPMAGFPHHQLDGYLAKLIQGGHRAAVCEQVEDPKKAKGLVKREVTRVVTPGTLTDEALLDPKQNNYLAAVFSVKRRQNDPDDVGLAWVDLSTGRFLATTVPAKQVCDHLARLAPAETLISEAESWLREALDTAYTLTVRPAWVFARKAAHTALTNQFATASLEGFGFGDQDDAAVVAAGAIIDYLNETQKTTLSHIDQLIPSRTAALVEIDQSTRRSLELAQTLRDGTRSGSLLGVIDRTVTPMGSRLLAEWLNGPLTDIDSISARHDTVEELVAAHELLDFIRQELREVYDLQRLLARASTGRASPRDLQFVGRTLAKLPKLKAKLVGRRSSLLRDLEQRLDLSAELRDQLEAALADECPLSTKDGGIIRPRFNGRLDELRDLAQGGKEWLTSYQQQLAESSQIPSLKIGFNKVFGFYVEVTHAHTEKVPEAFIRKQTLKNAERYITPELKEYEDRVLRSEEAAKELEYELFCELRDAVTAEAGRLRGTAEVLANLDVLCGLACLARERSYCRPVLLPEPMLEIVDGRHPVLDIVEPQGTFVPNDTRCDEEQGFILLITGPNMAGKSTYIRQVALISIMAQMGSFVPAKSARLGIADKIFARVGASDELSKGQSTFMVEMTETARILNTATSRSLVILDEIGRGTSTYDGVSLAWSIVEHLHDQIGCRTLFATHYHELTDLSESHQQIVNLNVAVKEWKDDVVFLHKIVPGSTNKSYGIHVAKLAGVPTSVNTRAREILEHLEATHRQDAPHEDKAPRPPKRASQFQLTLFEVDEHPIVEAVEQFDINACAPLEALQRIREWQEMIEARKQQS